MTWIIRTAFWSLSNSVQRWGWEINEKPNTLEFEKKICFLSLCGIYDEYVPFTKCNAHSKSYVYFLFFLPYYVQIIIKYDASNININILLRILCNIYVMYFFIFHYFFKIVFTLQIKLHQSIFLICSKWKALLFNNSTWIKLDIFCRYDIKISLKEFLIYKLY